MEIFFPQKLYQETSQPMCYFQNQLYILKAKKEKKNIDRKVAFIFKHYEYSLGRNSYLSGVEAPRFSWAVSA